MTKVFTLGGDGVTAMAPVKAQNEERDLQMLLAMNPELLPGEQMDPSSPRLWLPIGSELPALTGERWRIDYACGCQDAVLTLVECKRFADTRARREVVAQMLDYAANAPTFLNSQQLQQTAEDTASADNCKLSSRLLRMNTTPDEYFELMQDNIRAGKLRLVFFMDEAPTELKVLVEFLQSAMPNVEVHLVEAQQFELAGQRIIVPRLFGYREPARPAEIQATGKRWNRGRFFAAIEPEQEAYVRPIYDAAEKIGFEIRWGKGVAATFSLALPSLQKRPLFTLAADGALTVHSDTMGESRFASDARDHIAARLSEDMGLAVPGNHTAKPYSFAGSEWVGKADDVARVLREVYNEFA